MTASSQAPEAKQTTAARRRRPTDVAAGGVVAAAGVVLLVSARGIERLPSDMAVIGPAAFPSALSVMLVVGGLSLLVNGLRGVTDVGVTAEIMQIDDSEDVNELLEPDEPPVPLGRLLMVVGLFAAYCVAFIPLGFLLSTAGFLAAVTCLVDRAKWLRNGVFAAVFAVVVYVSFTQLLAVELPAGVLG